MRAPPATDPSQRRRGLLAIAALAVAYALMMQPLGWAQTSHYALVRALADGTPKIDSYHWETRDKSYYEGHFYSVKGPGLAATTLPLYEVLHALGAEKASRSAARAARDQAAGRWTAAGPPRGLYGYDLSRAVRVRATIEQETGMVWALGLLGVVLPAILLLLLVRALADRIEPGLGVAAAVTLGLGTLVLPFATVFFSHLLAALLGFAAFALLWREREGPDRLRLVALAGLLAGLAVTTEYPLAIVGAILGLYAIARARWLRRGLAYTAGVIAGVIPLAAYNLWAFGSLAHSSYEDAVVIQGKTGHAVLGLNESGFFGIDLPSVGTALDLLLAPRGLLVLSPVLVAAVAGTVMLFRRGGRAEALVIGGVSVAFLIYNAGYYLPFGGGSPGPRFLIPMLPFLAVPLAIAYRRLPAFTLSLAVPSALVMLGVTVTQPLLGSDATGYWAHVVDIASFEHTLATILGAGNGWGGILPVLLAVAVAVGLAASVSRSRPVPGDARLAAAAVVAWGCAAALAPTLFGDSEATKYAREWHVLILTCCTASLVLVAALAIRARRPLFSRVAEPLAERRGG